MTDRSDRARAVGYATRVARPEDAEQMADVHAEVWRATYTGLMRQDVLDALDPIAAADRWRDLLGGDSFDRTVWVAVDPDGDIVALASAGPGRAEDAPTPHELRAINVTRRAQGTGLADLMMADLVGDGPAYLWVVEQNERAIAFYRRHGFTVADRPWDEEYGVHELRMVRGPLP